jgi:hypothetical protein
MTTTSTEQALLIILSITLAIFLILGIVLLIYLIKISSTIKVIVDKAERLTEKAETMASFFEKTAPKIAIGRLLGNIAEAVSKRSKNRKEHDE